MTNFQLYGLTVSMIVMLLLVTMIFIQQLQHSEIINQLKTEKADKHDETYAKLLIAVKFIEDILEERTYGTTLDFRLAAKNIRLSLGKIQK